MTAHWQAEKAAIDVIRQRKGELEERQRTAERSSATATSPAPR